MSVLLRHPATVPALFSRSVEPECRARGRLAGASFAGRAPLILALAWTGMMLAEVPLVDVAAAAVGLPTGR